MPTKILPVFLWTLLALACLAFSSADFTGDPVRLSYPEGWPDPSYNLTKNPLTKQGIALGRRLFYDPALSRDSTISCSSCHLSFTAFAHVDHALSHGIEDRIGLRNAPALMNLAWMRSFMWDGAISHLDFQALAPIAHPAEMDFSIDRVIDRIQKQPAYRRLFLEAFGDSSLTGERFLKAMAQFELTLISANSKYDRMLEGKEAFTAQEQNGYQLFQKNCASCHVEPLFTNQGFEKNGLPLDASLMDFGRMKITGQSADSMKFKIPTLRNIEFSFPYMHDGRFKKLREVIQQYAENNSITPKIALNPNEKVDLLAFLLTLTDRDFLFNPDFSFPKE